MQGLVNHGSGQSLFLVACAIAVACLFEFINGFHDTANAVATVIYTRSLKPWTAVMLSGLCNFLGVFIGGTAVAMGILKLLPSELIGATQPAVALAMIFAMLLAAITWNLGTWYLGLPASSSHTLIGSILGIGLANAYVRGAPLGQAVNWSKAQDIGLALVVSPVFGFLAAALLLWGLRWLLRDPLFHSAPIDGATPPWKIRSILISTCSGVSFAHGSNDGQKGVGLVMLILITLLPAQYAVRFDGSAGQASRLVTAAQTVETLVTHGATEVATELKDKAYSLSPVRDAFAIELLNHQLLAKAGQHARDLRQSLEAMAAHPENQPTAQVRARILKLDADITKLETVGLGRALGKRWPDLQEARKALKQSVEFVPTWVILMIAVALGAGTMVGWRRIVVTLGEKIGKRHMTYAQGASAELVAMSTIGVSAFAGLPVSTTHVLSSGIAGTMVADRSGLNFGIVRNILLAWVLTLPVSMALSFSLFVAFTKLLA